MGDLLLIKIFTVGNFVGFRTGDFVGRVVTGFLVGLAMGDRVGFEGRLVGDPGARVGSTSLEASEGGKEATFKQFLPCQTQIVLFVHAVNVVISAQSVVGAIVGDKEVG